MMVDAWQDADDALERRAQQVERARVAMVVVCALVVATSHWLVGAPVPLRPLAAVLVALLTSSAASALARRAGRMSDGGLLGSMVLDVGLLTTLLALTGGHHNPFSLAYLVLVVISLVALGSRGATIVAAAAFVGYASLFVVPGSLLDAAGAAQPHGGHAQPLHAAHAAHHGHAGHAGHTGHADHVEQHMLGMWAASGIASVFIVYFVGGLVQSLQARERALGLARAEALRSQQLASLGALAAGAAHELGTPLTTIKVAAAELALDLQEAAQPALAAHAQQIRAEAARCGEILGQLGAGTGHARADSIERCTIATLLHDAVASIDAPIDLHIPAELAGQSVEAAPATFGPAFRALVDNALVASDMTSTPAPPEIRVSARGQLLDVAVVDRGPGMTPEILHRATEPFFSHRPHGHPGMGLGLFLAEQVAQQMGGGLALTSSAGAGTTVTWSIPLAPGARPNRAA
jgi:two-component system sensor histidine kinase RegB